MSDIIINNVVFPDGAPLPINNVQAQEVTVNSVSVWKNNIPPSTILDFSASDDQIGQVTMTFTPATGLPTPTHDLYADNVLVASGVSSGFVYAIDGPNTSDYHVQAVNVADVVNSNNDSGTSLFSRVWDGNSSIVGATGFDTAGNALTVRKVNDPSYPETVGSIIVGPNGLSGNSIANHNGDAFSLGVEFAGDSNGIRLRFLSPLGSGGWTPYIAFSTSTGFEVKTILDDGGFGNYGLEGDGGFRLRTNITNGIGPWANLVN